MLWSKAAGAGGTLGGGGGVLIDPALNGQTVWDGASTLEFGSSGEYTLTPTEDISVSVKMWGAGGACGYRYTDPITSTNNQGPGGGGGYSSATITLRAGVDYIFRIGEGGIRTVTTDSGATYLAGGIQSANGGAQGGGYTGIFKSSVSQPNALLMAGGGGGGGDGRYSNYAGAGGGSSGQNFSGSLNQGGLGGTQIAGGAASQFNGATAGSALLGGLGQSNESSLGGGGGGYFGGGGGNAGGGGGGSGRIGTDSDVSSGVTTTGSGSAPANSSDSDRGVAGQGGDSGTNSGADGKIILSPS